MTTNLASLGVRFLTGWAADRLRLTGSRIESVLLRDRSAALEEMAADWFVLAVPLSEAVRLTRQDLVTADPGLAGLERLVCDWMVGLQFYLRRPTPILHGHVLYLDSPWALTSISQAQFWRQIDFPATFGDGTVQDCLSVDISDWDSPGVFGKPARECTREEVAADVWAQLSAALNGRGDQVLSDDLVHSWFLDPAVTGLGGPGRRATPNRCSSTRWARGTIVRTPARPSRTSSSPAISPAPRSTWRRWRVLRRAGAPRSTRSWSALVVPRRRAP